MMYPSGWSGHQTKCLRNIRNHIPIPKPTPIKPRDVKSRAADRSTSFEDAEIYDWRDDSEERGTGRWYGDMPNSHQWNLPLRAIKMPAINTPVHAEIHPIGEFEGFQLMRLWIAPLSIGKKMEKRKEGQVLWSNRARTEPRH